mmetsp:Transcript_53454/g.153368  ORF Transcript_53454/g.153368 Transcript_53454/m.153368 type:complete len:607 (-) Transcript_53454:45-1865(-)
MKSTMLRSALLACVGHHTAASLFGPDYCVSLSQSSSGSCVIATNCEGHDLSQFEFVFDCDVANNGGVVRHSFGKGGFDVNEEYDTEVVCDRCAVPPYLLPTPPPAPKPKPVATPVVTKPVVPAPTAKLAVTAAKTPAKRMAHPAASATIAPAPLAKAAEAPAPKVLAKSAAQAAAPKPAAAASRQKKILKASLLTRSSASSPAPAPEKEEEVKPPPRAPPPPPPVKYGPRGCVSTFKSKEGHCIMQTKCTSLDIKGYSFGLVCVDKIGQPVRHLFGKDSFDPVETFDTLISCDQCLGLEDIPQDVAVNGQVVAMTQEIADMRKIMANLTEEVSILSKKVLADETKPAEPAPRKSGHKHRQEAAVDAEEEAAVEAPPPAVFAPAAAPMAPAAALPMAPAAAPASLVAGSQHLRKAHSNQGLLQSKRRKALRVHKQAQAPEEADAAVPEQADAAEPDQADAAAPEQATALASTSDVDQTAENTAEAAGEAATVAAQDGTGAGDAVAADDVQEGAEEDDQGAEDPVQEVVEDAASTPHVPPAPPAAPSRPAAPRAARSAKPAPSPPQVHQDDAPVDTAPPADSEAAADDAEAPEDTQGTNGEYSDGFDN